MPTDRALYASAFEIPDLVPKDLGGWLTCPVYRDDALVEPTSGTVTVYRPDGSAFAEAAVTVANSIARYQITSAALTNEQRGMKWRTRWLLVIDGQTYAFKGSLGIVRDAPQPPASDKDLVARVARIDQGLSGTGATTWQHKLDEAWYQLNRWLNRQGNRADLIVDGSDLKDLHTLWALDLILTDIIGAEGEGGTWGTQAARIRDDLKREKDTATFTYDANDDGQPDVDQRAAQPQTFLSSHGMAEYGDGYHRPWSVIR